MSTVGFKESRSSPQKYFLWRLQRARGAIERIARYCELQNAKVLDIGCGYGAVIKLFLDRGAKVFGTEIDGDKIQLANAFLRRYREDNHEFVIHKVSDGYLPFLDNTFDVVILFDVIEHMAKPEIAIEECKRVLKNNAILYIEFTPYYSIIGHHLYDYAKWPIHIFSAPLIKKIVFKKKIKSFLSPEHYWKQFESLNKLRISKMQSMVKDCDTIEERFIIKYPELFEINFPLLNFLGPLKDTFTMSFEGMYKKRDRA